MALLASGWEGAWGALRSLASPNRQLPKRGVLAHVPTQPRSPPASRAGSVPGPPAQLSPPICGVSFPKESRADCDLGAPSASPESHQLGHLTREAALHPSTRRKQDSSRNRGTVRGWPAPGRLPAPRTQALPGVSSGQWWQRCRATAQSHTHTQGRLASSQVLAQALLLMC